MTLSLGVLVSGSGSNLQAILDAISRGELSAEVRVVLCNRPGAYALTRAKNAGIRAVCLDHKSFPSREDFDTEMLSVLKDAGVEWVALAGFMRVLSKGFLDAFKHRVVNIHPSLLPAFPGVNAQKQAFDYGVRVAGCTVHFVDDGVDTGPIISQRAVPVHEDDTVESLRDRILEQEHKAFVEALRFISEGRVEISSDGRRVHIQGEASDP